MKNFLVAISCIAVAAVLAYLAHGGHIDPTNF